jgi:hypothetical protein
LRAALEGHDLLSWLDRQLRMLQRYGRKDYEAIEFAVIPRESRRGADRRPKSSRAAPGTLDC